MRLADRVAAALAHYDKYSSQAANWDAAARSVLAALREAPAEELAELGESVLFEAYLVAGDAKDRPFRFTERASDG